MKWLTFALLLAVLTPMDKVNQYAAKIHQRVTITQHSDGYWWIELDKDSDVFGVGKTVDEAAWDFLTAADTVAHETNHPYLKRKTSPKLSNTKKCPAGQYCT